MTQPRAYVAHPLTSYDTPRARAAVGRVAELLAGVEVLDPEQAGWEGAEEWLSGWNGLVEHLDGLVLVPDADGFVGAGCLHEVADMFARNKIVALLHEGELVQMASIEFRRDPWAWAEQVGRPRAGRRFQAGEVAAMCAAVARLRGARASR